MKSSAPAARAWSSTTLFIPSHTPTPPPTPLQCGRFQPLEDFDDNKRSCRARLERHNARRRKRPREDGGATSAGGVRSSMGHTMRREFFESFWNQTLDWASAWGTRSSMGHTMQREFEFIT